MDTPRTSQGSASGRFPVVLDSDVLFGVNSMDLLMSLGHAGLFRPHWTHKILEDARRNILLVRPASTRALGVALRHDEPSLLPALSRPPTFERPGDSVLAAAVHIIPRS